MYIFLLNEQLINSENEVKSYMYMFLECKQQIVIIAVYFFNQNEIAMCFIEHTLFSIC
jgi:hypothetical protein